MSYYTHYSDYLTLNPPLTEEQIEEIRDMDDLRIEVFGSKYLVNNPWLPTEETLEPPESDYEPRETLIAWLKKIVDEKLTPWRILANGTIYWDGEDVDDNGTIVVSNNKVDEESDITITETQYNAAKALAKYLNTAFPGGFTSRTWEPYHTFISAWK